MKKRITQADGTVVEYEGTPEEIAEIERGTLPPPRKDEGKKKGRRILNEERVAEMIQEALGKHNRETPHVPFFPPIVIDRHSHCVGCPHCQPWKFVRPYYEPIWIGDQIGGTSKITWTTGTTSDFRVDMASGPHQTIDLVGVSDSSAKLLG